MSKVFITDTYLTNIANAIRVKNGTNETYTPAEMADAIEAMPIEEHEPIHVHIVQSPHQTIKAWVDNVNLISINENDDPAIIEPPEYIRIRSTIIADEGYKAGTLNSTSRFVSWGSNVTFSATAARPIPIIMTETSTGPYDLDDQPNVRFTANGPLDAGQYKLYIGDSSVYELYYGDPAANATYTISSALSEGNSATWTYSFHRVTENDILAGAIPVVIVDPNDDVIFESELETADCNGHLTITITPDANNVYACDSTCDFTVTVENDGNLTITDIIITCESTDDEWTTESLAPGQTKTFTSAYIVTEDDEEYGEFTLTFEATGTSPDPNEPDVQVEPGVFHVTMSRKTFWFCTGKILENTGVTYGETYNNEVADYMHMQMMPLYLGYDTDAIELEVGTDQTINSGLKSYIGTFGLWNEQNEHIIDGSAGMAIYSDIPRFVSGTAEYREDLASEAVYGDSTIEDIVESSPSYWSGYDVPEDLAALNENLDPLILGVNTVVLKTLSQFEEALNIIIGNSTNLSYFDDYNMTNPHIYDLVFCTNGFIDPIHLIKVEENTFYDSSLTRDQNYLEACKRLHEGIMDKYYIPFGYMIIEKGDTVNYSVSFTVSPTSMSSAWTGNNTYTLSIAGTAFKLIPGNTVTRRVGPVGSSYNTRLSPIPDWTWSQDYVSGIIAGPESIAISVSRNESQFTIYLRYTDGTACGCSYSGTVGGESVSGNAAGSIVLTGYAYANFNITLSNWPQGYTPSHTNVSGTLNNSGITVSFRTDSGGIIEIE